MDERVKKLEKEVADLKKAFSGILTDTVITGAVRKMGDNIVREDLITSDVPYERTVNITDSNGDTASFKVLNYPDTVLTLKDKNGKLYKVIGYNV